MKFRIWNGKLRAWLRPQQRGFTINRDQAGLYNLEEAIDICVCSNIGQPPNEPPLRMLVPLDFEESESETGRFPDNNTTVDLAG